tara:strand:+ start:217 stop:606 length:390 start_codon:yes stop_codon:yes gene_type:complete
MFNIDHEDQAQPTLKHVGIEDPPLLGKEFPLVKDSDPESTKPQHTPFFSSRQFQLWEDTSLAEYNQLIDALMKWRDRGWCEFSEELKWVEAHQNWVTWIKWYTVMQVPAAEVSEHLSTAALHPDINPAR